MADAAPVVHIGENSPEEVAFKLLHAIAKGEGKSHHGSITADRKWILNTYAECLDTIQRAKYFPPQ